MVNLVAKRVSNGCTHCNEIFSKNKYIEAKNVALSLMLPWLDKRVIHTSFRCRIKWTPFQPFAFREHSLDETIIMKFERRCLQWTGIR